MLHSLPIQYGLLITDFAEYNKQFKLIHDANYRVPVVNLMSDIHSTLVGKYATPKTSFVTNLSSRIIPAMFSVVS